MSTSSNNSRLLIDTIHFRKEITQRNELDDLKGPFYSIYKKYDKLMECEKESRPEFQRLISSKKDNNSLFYTGVEEKARKQAEYTLILVNENTQKIIKNLGINVIYETNIIKTIIPSKNNKQKRLLSVWLKVYYCSKNNDTHYLDIIYPVLYDDFH